MIKIEYKVYWYVQKLNSENSVQLSATANDDPVPPEGYELYVPGPGEEWTNPEILYDYPNQTIIPYAVPRPGVTCVENDPVSLNLVNYELPKEPPSTRLLYDRNNDTKYNVVYMLQNYDDITGEVREGYHPADEDVWITPWMPLPESGTYNITRGGTTGATVDIADLPEDVGVGKHFPGFKYIEKYDPQTEGEGHCYIAGEGLDPEDLYYGRNTLRVYFNKNEFELTVNYHVPEGFDKIVPPELLTSVHQIHTVLESYKVVSPDLREYNLTTDLEVVAGEMPNNPLVVDVYYYDTNRVEVNYKVNDPNLGYTDPSYETYGNQFEKPKGSVARASEKGHFVNWTNEAGEVVSTDPTYVPEKYVPEPESEAQNGWEDVTIVASETYTANFEANPEEPEFVNGSAQTGDPLNAGILTVASLAVIAGLLMLLRTRKRDSAVRTRISK